MRPLVLREATVVLTQDRALGESAAVGRDLPRDGAETLVVSGCIVTPGLVNTLATCSSR